MCILQWNHTKNKRKQYYDALYHSLSLVKILDTTPFRFDSNVWYCILHFKELSVLSEHLSKAP